jgi:Phage integrase family
MEAFLLDAAGRRRSPATMPGFHHGRPPRNKGLQYPPDPPSVEEIVAVMRAAGDSGAGIRMRALVVILWRAGLRISEALALAESDLDQQRGTILVRRGKGGKRREVGMDAGRGSSSSLGLSSESRCRSGCCCAWSMDRREAGRGRPPLLEKSFGR